MFPGILSMLKTSLEGIKLRAEYLLIVKLGMDNAEHKKMFETGWCTQPLPD